MFNKKFNVFLFVFIALILGSLSSSNTGNDPWYQGLVKSDINPPGYIFGIVWPILYFLMSISAYRSYEIIKKLFFIQLFFNMIWSWLFFYFQMPLIALGDILLLIYLNIRILVILFKSDLSSGILYAPYILWLCFASYLNLFIVLNN